MPSEHDRIVEQLFEDYQRQRSRMADLSKQLQEISATATSPRREVAVTVQHQGGISDLKFLSGAYKRMAPADLAELILATVAEARKRAGDAAAELLAPMLPSSMNAREIVSGKLDLESIAPAAGPLLPTVVHEHLHR